jgi:hypothetical protein
MQMRFLLGFSCLICCAIAQYIPPPPAVTPILDKIRCAIAFTIDTQNCTYVRCDDKESGNTAVAWLSPPPLASVAACGELQAVQNTKLFMNLNFSVTADNWLYRIHTVPEDASKVVYVQYADEELCTPKFIVGSYSKTAVPNSGNPTFSEVQYNTV